MKDRSNRWVVDLGFPDLPLLNSLRDIERINACWFIIVDYAADVNVKPDFLPELHEPLLGFLDDSFAVFVDSPSVHEPKRDHLLPHQRLVRFNVSLKGISLDWKYLARKEPSSQYFLVSFGHSKLQIIGKLHPEK